MIIIIIITIIIIIIIIVTLHISEDGRVDQAEWVTQWVCVYGDSADYARFRWASISQGNDFITASQFSGPPFGMGR